VYGATNQVDDAWWAQKVPYTLEDVGMIYPVED
jgi:hypothetical protein